jgi:FPC/CPF motif-containing protein YcgG
VFTLKSKGGRKIREKIRTKVSIYNCGIVSKELGFYGAEDNKEWQQYQLEEEGITRPTRCPFKKDIIHYLIYVHLKYKDSYSERVDLIG